MQPKYRGNGTPERTGSFFCLRACSPTDPEREPLKRIVVGHPN